MHSNTGRALLPRRARRPDRRAPRQERSRATRDRILAALTLLLEHKRFDAITTAELTRAAQCSMSSFYARFPTKDALLSAFHDRFFDYSVHRVGAALDAIDAARLPLDERVRQLLSFFIRSYREHRGLLRSLVLHDRKQATSAFAARTRAYKHMVMERALAVVLKGERRAAQPKVIQAFGFTLWLVVLAIENVVLFDGLVGSEHVSDEKLTEELTKVFVGRIKLAEERA
jgi:AcrR family transcriptional regulator